MPHHVASVLGLLFLFAWGGAAKADALAATSIPAANLIEPAQLAADLKGPAQSQPLIWQVGFRKLYDQAHIPGARYAGPANAEAGMQSLREQLAGVPKQAAIVIYCGCCPWTKCPNIAAAFQTLQALGYQHVRVLHIAEDFGTNWVEQGYPSEPSR